MGLTQVSTDGVKDGSLLNADINASAAIAKSKIENLINNNADNRVITGSGTANTLNAESDVVIDSSGRLGIGCTPTAQFGHNILQIGNQSTLGANAALSTTGQTYLTHNLYFDTGGTYQVFNTSNANEGAIIQLVDGTFKFSNAAATTGTPTVTQRIRFDSDGLKFGSDTAAANALDDYEKGTFNPILQNGNNGYRFQYGFYTKIGSAVHFTAFIETSATPPSSNIAIGGLPFTSRNESNANAYVFPMLTNRTSFGTSGQMNARFYMYPNTTFATLYYPVSSSSSNFQTVNANNMNAANASNIWMSGTYFTND